MFIFFIANRKNKRHTPLGPSAEPQVYGHNGDADHPQEGHKVQRILVATGIQPNKSPAENRIQNTDDQANERSDCRIKKDATHSARISLEPFAECLRIPRMNALPVRAVVPKPSF